MEIKDVIRSKRLEKKLTMKQVADLIGVSEGTISRWEGGQIENMKRDNVAQLSKVLDISPAVIMGWEDYVEAASDLLIERHRAESSQAMRITNQFELNLIRAYRQLNDSGKLECMSHLDYLLTQERFTKDTESQDA